MFTRAFNKIRSALNSNRSIQIDSQQVVLWCESLERRDMLSGIGFDPGTGLVTITGSAGDDIGLVSMFNLDTVEVELTGIAVQQFDLSQINDIKFLGFDGNDYFQNSTAIDSVALGHAGADQLFGGSGMDRLIGGSGDDTIEGNGGADSLFGSQDNDTIRGGDGDDLIGGQFGQNNLFGDGGADRIIGGSGNDTIYGGDGDDRAWGFDGDDFLNGDAGDDFLRGVDGVDEIHGGAGEDVILGDAGDDALYGDADFDVILGGLGNDVIEGGDARDHLYGMQGDDVIRGDAGNDAIFGADGNDELYGGDGPDLIRGGAGTDTLYGGAAADRLYGDDGNDLLFGDDGQDQLYGNNDNDTLYGGSNRDYLYGGAGNDGLFGGDLSFADELSGQIGADRLLIQDNDIIVGSSAIDATLVFVDRTSNWTELEIRGIDEGLQRLHDLTNNTTLLKDPYPSGDLTFYKYLTTPSGAPASNYFAYNSETSCGPGGCNTTYTYFRELRFADWNENNAFEQGNAGDFAIHEVGHNFDSQEELTRVDPSLANTFGEFLGASGWTDTNPNNPSEYSLSGDGQWWHLNSASFVWSYGRTNPNEDFSTLWEYYFDEYQNDHDRADLNPKLQILDDLFDSIVS